MYKKLEELGFFEWLDKVHNLVDTDMKPEYLDRLPLDDIHRTVCNAMAFRWFREKYNLHAVIIPTITMYWTFKTMTVVEGMVEVPPYNHVDAIDYSTYEQAMDACIDKLIELAKRR